MEKPRGSEGRGLGTNVTRQVVKEAAVEKWMVVVSEKQPATGQRSGPQQKIKTDRCERQWLQEVQGPPTPSSDPRSHAEAHPHPQPLPPPPEAGLSPQRSDRSQTPGPVTLCANLDVKWMRLSPTDSVVTWTTT